MTIPTEFRMGLIENLRDRGPFRRVHGMSSRHKTCDACRVVYLVDGHGRALDGQRWAAVINGTRYVVCDPCFHLFHGLTISRGLLP